jgi:thymidylate synthase
MQQYLKFLQTILSEGARKNDRTNTGTISHFGYQMRFNLSEGFPIITTKKIHLKSVIVELLWFLRGETNIQYLKDHNVSIWNEWADEKGELGPVYGKQWRSWQSNNNESIDQIKILINEIQHNPDSRRLIVNSWNVSDLNKMALAPCHCLFQFYVANGKLSCQLYQRSADAFLGVPFNISSYALLTYMIAHQTNLEVGEFIWTGGDCHIYLNHLEQVNIQLQRNPLKLPTLSFKRKPQNIFDYEFQDFLISDYEHHPAISGKVAV